MCKFIFLDLQKHICFRNRSKILSSQMHQSLRFRTELEFSLQPIPTSVVNRRIPSHSSLCSPRGRAAYDISIHMQCLRTRKPLRMVSDRAENHVRWMRKTDDGSGTHGNRRPGPSAARSPLRSGVRRASESFLRSRRLAGKKIRCNGCGKGVRVPQGDEEPIGQSSRTGTNRDSGSDEMQAPARSTRGPSAPIDARPAAENGAIQRIATARRTWLDQDVKAPEEPRDGLAVASRVDGAGPRKGRGGRGR